MIILLSTWLVILFNQRGFDGGIEQLRMYIRNRAFAPKTVTAGNLKMDIAFPEISE